MNPTLEELIEEVRQWCAKHNGWTLEMTWSESDGNWRLMVTDYGSIIAEVKNWKNLREALMSLLRRMAEQ